MHDIEPYFNWRNHYVVEEDTLSPFFGRDYDQFYFTNKIYNYYIHPQWDEFGSDTLYLKILYADYDEGCCIIELIGEWNDCLHNDIMFLKRKVLDVLMYHGIHKFVMIGENVLNFHAGDDDYYEEWWENTAENGGWILFLNLHRHVYDEMINGHLQRYVLLLPHLMNYEWRKQTPDLLFKTFDALVNNHKYIETE